jgi:hypothetical protein
MINFFIGKLDYSHVEIKKKMKAPTSKKQRGLMLRLAHTAGVNTGMQIQVHLQGPQSLTHCLLLLFKGFEIRKTTSFFSIHFEPKY